MFNWFEKKKTLQDQPILKVDIHSHLLPGIDDGVRSLEEAEQLILKFKELGYTKLITSPHVHELYRNSTQTILNKLSELKLYLEDKEITMHIEAIAEYSLDEWLLEKVGNHEPLLTFHRNYLLFETNFFSDPLVLNDFIFQISSQGYKPVLAHPERYMYLIDNKNRIEDLLARGVLFQLNTLSLAGMYGPIVEKLSKFLIDQQYVHFMGSDCHNLQHMVALQRAQKSKYYIKALSLPLINYSL